MCQAIDHLALRLFGYIPQHPFEFQDHGLENEHVASRKHASSNTPLHRIVAEIKACKDVRVNRAHASRPSSSPTHRASGALESEGPCNSGWPPRPRCVKRHAV